MYAFSLPSKRRIYLCFCLHLWTGLACLGDADLPVAKKFELWIRISIRIGYGLNWVPGSGSQSGFGSRRAKMTPKNGKKLITLHFLKCWMFCFEGYRLLLVACMSFMKTYGKVNCNYGSKRQKNFFSCTYFFFFHFWSSIPWIQIRSGSALVSGSGFDESGSTTLLKNPKNYANMNTIHSFGNHYHYLSGSGSRHRCRLIIWVRIKAQIHNTGWWGIRIK